MLFSKYDTKSLFTPWKLWLIKQSKYGFLLYYFGSDLYLFQLIVLLKTDFNCWSSFVLSWIDKVTTGTQSFVLVIANIPAPVELVMTQVHDHFNWRLILQLINDIPSVLQKLLKYFNCTTISTSFVLSSAGVFPVIFILDLNDSKSFRFSFGSFL